MESSTNKSIAGMFHMPPGMPGSHIKKIPGASLLASYYVQLAKEDRDYPLGKFERHRHLDEYRVEEALESNGFRMEVHDASVFFCGESASGPEKIVAVHVYPK
jgi:hypothetical protein